MPRLYEIKTAYDAIAKQIEEMEGELTNELEFALDAVNDEYDNKLSNCCALIKEWEMEGEKFKLESKRLAAIANAYLNRAEKLRDYVSKNFPRDQRWSHGVHHLSWRPSSEVEVDMSILPEQYHRVKREPDKKLVRADIECSHERRRSGDIEDSRLIPGARIVHKLNLQVK